MSERNYNFIDRLCMTANQALKTMFSMDHQEKRKNPAIEALEPVLNENEVKLSQRLLRVDYAGEVAAQGLYHGHGLVARKFEVQEQMERAADEENDHLAWCATRINELGGRKSFLDPVWYAGAFGIGVAAGLLGDKYGLGFVVETERQVVRHIEDHLERISSNDDKSRLILEQMKIDEAQHAREAYNSGAKELPFPVRFLMKCASKVMTKTAFYI